MSFSKCTPNGTSTLASASLVKTDREDQKKSENKPGTGQEKLLIFEENKELLK